MSETSFVVSRPPEKEILSPLTSVVFYSQERQVFRPRESDPRTGKPLTVSQWAERYRIVTEGGQKGPWSNDFTPFSSLPMDCWSIPYIRQIFLCFSPQSSKSQIALNCLGYSIDQDPGPAMYVLPTEDKAKEVGKGKIKDLLEKTPRVNQYQSPRSEDNTNLSYKFNTGMDLRVTWAGSATALSEVSIEKMIFDEIDKYADFTGREAEPLALGEERTNSYPYTKKLLYLSTPGMDPSAIFELLIHEADIVYAFEARCPVCGHYQIIKLENIHWPDTDPRAIFLRRLAYYSCEKCPASWNDFARDVAVKAGQWVPGKMNSDFTWEPVADPEARPESVGFWLPSWYSPFISLSKVAYKYLKSKENLKKHIAFVTQYQVIPYRQVIKTPVQSEILAARCDLRPQTVPQDAIVLTMGVDIHKYGFWFTVRAFARDYTSWLIHYGNVSTWTEVEDIIFNTAYPIQGTGNFMRLWRVGVDTGGSESADFAVSLTESAYWWLVKVIPAAMAMGIGIYGTKGSSTSIPGIFKLGEEILRTPSGKKLPDWFRLVRIDTHQMKDSLHYHLQRAVQHEQQGAYLHCETDRVYASHITAEEKRRDKKNRDQWVKIRRDNHLLDCEVIAMSLAHYQWPIGGVNTVLPPPATSGDEPRPGSSWLGGANERKPQGGWI